MGAPAGCTEIHRTRGLLSCRLRIMRGVQVPGSTTSGPLTIDPAGRILGSRRDRGRNRARWAGRSNPLRGRGYLTFLKCSFPQGWNCLASKSMPGCASMEDATSGSPYDALRISGRVVYPIRSSPDAPRTSSTCGSFSLTSQGFCSFHALRPHGDHERLPRATKDLFLTQRFARHANPITTVAYTHPSDGELYEAIRGIAR